ncbi:MAG: signal recognition particle-docking protein FtsY [Thermoprotei archaeon]|mgnify:CR=1 FL=1|nr:MAG: signal recognition particle-docking protein FtsY [Thermoprotei archaeon]RLF00490.1 MAG: signal recognition particle-docking protein FtsY [Thermoprotei archaeon]
MFTGLKKTLSKIVARVAHRGLSSYELEEISEEILLMLVENDVAYEVAEKISELIKERLSNEKIGLFENPKERVLNILSQILIEILTPKKEVDLEKLIKEKASRSPPFVILFVGPNGQGKTTTIVKIARYLKSRGYSVVIAAADTFRAGAIEQLEALVKRVGAKVIKQKYGADPAAVAYDAVMHARSKKVSVVLIDTAGRLQTDKDLMEEMAKIKRVVSPDLVIFVADALMGNDAVNQALEFDRYVGIDAVILTKADTDAKGGAALSITYVTGKPLIFLGTGQNLDDLVRFNAQAFVKTLLEAD